MSLNMIEAVLSGGEKEPTPKEWKLIGFYGSSEMRALLALAAVGKGMGKSKLLRKIVQDWLEQNDPVKVATDRVKELLTSPTGMEMNRKTFKSRIKTFLEQKKVPDELIKEVLQSI